MRYQVHFIDVQNDLKNYIWMLEDTETQEVVAIDPTESKLVENFCEQHHLKLTQIWLTHWHKDHIGGVPALIAQYSIPVFGPREELSKIPFITHALQHADQFRFNQLNVDIIATPGHTLGHIVYLSIKLIVYFAVIHFFHLAVVEFLKVHLNKCITP